MMHTYTAAMSDPTLPVGTMLPVSAATVPPQFKALVDRGPYLDKFWTEVVAPMKGTHRMMQSDNAIAACEFGCKLYARRQGAVTVYAVHHSLTYGHSHSPQVR